MLAPFLSCRLKRWPLRSLNFNKKLAVSPKSYVVLPQPPNMFTSAHQYVSGAYSNPAARHFACFCGLRPSRATRNSGHLQINTGELDHAETHTGNCPHEARTHVLSGTCECARKSRGAALLVCSST